MEKRSFPESILQAYRWGIAGIVAIVFTDAVAVVENSDNLPLAVIIAIVVVLLILLAGAGLDYRITNRMVEKCENVD